MERRFTDETLEKGQMISVLNEFDGEWTLYFYTGESDRKYGNLYHTFCKADFYENDSPFGFENLWGVSVRYLNECIEKGTIKVVDKFCDLALVG